MGFTRLSTSWTATMFQPFSTADNARLLYHAPGVYKSFDKLIILLASYRPPYLCCYFNNDASRYPASATLFAATLFAISLYSELMTAAWSARFFVVPASFPP